MKLRHHSLALLAVALAAATVVLSPATAQEVLGDYVVLSWNDLGMHCMNQDHDQISILPPYNNLLAQVIERGNATTLPHIVTSGVTIEYSIPGNTYSVGKTNFWSYEDQLFGVNLPDNVGLTGHGLTGEFVSGPNYWIADGIPVTPFTDANPTVEDPYQQALVILKDPQGNELHRSQPVIPVSTEVNCVSTGCHSSINNILNEHENEGGFDPNNTPILCAQCHGMTPLTGPNPGTAGYFSRRIHEKHDFLDQSMPGIAGCYKCHPGQNTSCLRGTMSTNFGLVCQDCHGNMHQVSDSIGNGRTPWIDEPACRTCHTATYGEPVGTLYRNAVGHGGVRCAACHDSPHAIAPSRVDRDNAKMIALQGHAGTLSDCTVCHGVVPSGAGPHGITSTAVVEGELLGGASKLATFPNPVRAGGLVRIRGTAESTDGGHLLVFDAAGRTIRKLEASVAGSRELTGAWDGRNARGESVAPGVYFVRWTRGEEKATGKVVVID